MKHEEEEKDLNPSAKELIIMCLILSLAYWFFG